MEKPKPPNLVVRLPPHLKAQLTRLAQEEDRTLSGLVRHLLIRALVLKALEGQDAAS